MFSKRFRDILLFWGFALAGAAALIYEVVWERALSGTIGGSVYSLSTLLAAFLAGLALGGHFGGRFLSGKKDHVLIFGALELGVGVSGIAAYYLIINLPFLYGLIFYQLRSNFFLFSVAQFMIAFFVTLVPTTLMGAVFPVVAEAWSLSNKEIGRNKGNIYSVNAWGSVAGALAAGFILLPILGTQSTNWTAAAICIGLACLSFAIARSRRLMLTALLALVALPALAYVKTPSGLRFNFAVSDHYRTLDEFETAKTFKEPIFDREGLHGRVMVFKERSLHSNKDQLMLVNGGRLEGSTGADLSNQRLMAYLSLAAHPNPKSVLDIGVGTGTTLATAARDKRLKVIDSVEINPVVYEAVEKYFFPELFKDRRVRRISDDARHYLQLTEQKYDVIMSMPSYPTRKSVAHLYTKEFYEIAAKRLRANGVFAQWLPRYLLDPTDLAVAVKTIQTVFPNTYAWDIKTFGDDIILVALKSNRPLDPEAIKTRVEALDKEVYGLSFGAAPADLAKAVAPAAISINTDDLPLIEFAAVRNKTRGALSMKRMFGAGRSSLN